MTDKNYALHLGDCIEVMRAMPGNSVDSIVCDPPYELGFMGKAWDASGIANNPDLWREALRVLKPGGHMLAFSGSRTYHRMTCAIEDAGFEVRDQIMWVYGSGFPKSLDVSKAIDKAGGVGVKTFKQFLRTAVQQSGMTRKAIDDACGFTMRFDIPYEDDPRGWGVSLPSSEKWATICVVLGLDASRWTELVDRVWRGRAGAEVGGNGSMSGANYERTDKGEAVTDAARQWDGWGTALKPAHEPICVARKPLIGTVASNVLAHGTGALNIDGCRVAGDLPTPFGNPTQAEGWRLNQRKTDWQPNTTGRWPANLIHDGSGEVLAAFPESSVTGRRSSDSKIAEVKGTDWLMNNHQSTEYTDAGSAARFFYCAKTSKADRGAENEHPTVKPTDLMAYLCRLVTPPGGIVLDPFMGSGSTGKACMREGFRFVGIDMMPEYLEIARSRIEAEHQRIADAGAAPAQPDLFGASA